MIAAEDFQHIIRQNQTAGVDLLGKCKDSRAALSFAKLLLAPYKQVVHEGADNERAAQDWLKERLKAG